MGAIGAGSRSTQNLLPNRIWAAYRKHVHEAGTTNAATREDAAACGAFISRLKNPRLSAVLRGELFLGEMQSLVYDCVLDDETKGKRLLDDLRDFYRRNDLDYPNQLIHEDISKLRAAQKKVLNGWGTPHCAEFQKGIGSNELDFAVSEMGMRRRLFPEVTK